MRQEGESRKLISTSRVEEPAFINFHFTGNWRLSLTKLGYPLPDGHEIPIDGVAV